MELSEIINNWIQNYQFEEIRREKFKLRLEDLDVHEQGLIVFDELVALINENPQKIVDVTKNQLRNNQNLTFMISSMFESNSRDSSNFNPDSSWGKINFISKFWEVSTLFKFPAFLLTKRNIPIEKFNDRKQILKHFRFLGLTNNDIDDIRKIRNAHFHPFSIKNNTLINDKGEEVVNLETINSITHKINEIGKWWLFTLGSLMYYNPVFTNFVLYAIVDEVKSNKNSYLEISEFLQAFMPVNKEKEEQEEKPLLLTIWINKGWKFIKSPVVESKRFIYSKLANTIIGEMIPQISQEEVLLLLSNGQSKQKEFGELMVNLSSKLSDNEEVLRMQKLGLAIINDSKKKIDLSRKYDSTAVKAIKRQLDRNK